MSSFPINSRMDKEAELVRRKVRQVAKAKLDLEITPSLRVGVAMYIKSKIVSLPAIKKADAASGGAVRLDRTYVLADDVDTVVESKAVALRYGEEYVKISPDQFEEMKIPAESRCLRIIAFFDRDQFPLQRLISNADCVAAEPGNPHAAIALSALIHALLESEKVALCRLVARENAEPKLVVLFPHADAAIECFYAVQAPFCEDSRESTLVFPPLPTPSQELLAAVDELIDSRVLDDAVLVPELTINPTIHRFWKTVELRVATRDPSAIAPIDPEVDDLIHPERYVEDSQRVAAAVEAVRNIANLEERQQETDDSKKKRKYWRDLQTDNQLVNSPSKVDVKRIRIEDGVEGEDIDEPVVDVVRQYVSQLSQQSTQASQRLDPAIVAGMEILLSQIKAGHAKDAMSQIEQLRDQCIVENAASTFNDFMRKLVEQAPQHPRFWREMIATGITLVAKEDVPAGSHSSVKESHRDSIAFIEDVMKLV